MFKKTNSEMVSGSQSFYNGPIYIDYNTQKSLFVYTKMPINISVQVWHGKASLGSQENLSSVIAWENTV